MICSKYRDERSHFYIPSLIRSFPILACFCLFLNVKAQEKKTTVVFDYYTHDFGTIKEDGGLVSYEFSFTNDGHAPLTIKNVQASCGCTVPSWPRQAIAPGNADKIRVEFNPMNKPGPFSKTLTVFSNSANEATILTVMGKVVPKPRRPSDDFPDAIGNLRMISRYMNLGEVTTEKPLRREYTLYNQSDTVISVQKTVYNTTGFLKVTVEPKDVQPKSKAKIYIDYDPALRNDFGYVHDKIELQTNDKLQPVKQVFVASTITKYFAPLADVSKAPKIKIDKYTHDFGNLKQGDKPTVVFTIRNEGAELLNIYKVKPSCGCTITELEKKIIAPGESGKITMTFDTSGKEGVQEKHINLYCNDPANFNVIVSLKAKILK